MVFTILINQHKGGEGVEFDIKDIKIIEDFEGNRYKQIDKNTPFEKRDALMCCLNVSKDFIKIEGIESEKVSLRKRDRRTLNNSVFAKIV